MFEYPTAVLFASLILLSLATRLGAALPKNSEPEVSDDGRSTVLAATLTLLALIVGFTFSMAVNRYDQRKSAEVEEANAIGTAYMRAGLLPSTQAGSVRTLLKKYLDQRVLFYTTTDETLLWQTNARTGELQTALWLEVRDAAVAQPTPVAALVVASINEVFDMQGRTQAAWWNRIPLGAWALMISMAFLSNLLIGFWMKDEKRNGFLMLVLPIALSVSFFLIADIDSPRYGVIQVSAKNLGSVVDELEKKRPS